MDAAELSQLLTPDGMALLDQTPLPDDSAEAVRTVTRLRSAGHDPRLVAAVVTQARLRKRAITKFGDFASRMLFTEAGLEQATRLPVAALHAGRFARADLRRVADLGCGIGGDAMAFAALDLEVTAVDRDEITAAIATHNLAPWPNVNVELGEAETVDLSRFDGVWLDPARRTAGHSATRRLSDPDDWSPSLGTVFAAAASTPTGVKLGPGIDRDLIPSSAEAQWTSVGRDVVELVLWFGPLARPGVRRAATVIGAHGTAELTASDDSEDPEIGPLGEYIYEPDGTVIRARLIGDLARSIDAHILSEGIAYLSGDRLVATPFAQSFRVIEALPLDAKRIAARLAKDEVGSVEVKKRGVDIDPAAFRKRLRLRGGTQHRTIVLTRLAGRHTAILCERVDATPAGQSSE